MIVIFKKLTRLCPQIQNIWLQSEPEFNLIAAPPAPRQMSSQCSKRKNVQITGSIPAFHWNSGDTLWLPTPLNTQPCIKIPFLSRRRPVRGCGRPGGSPPRPRPAASRGVRRFSFAWSPAGRVLFLRSVTNVQVLLTRTERRSALRA